MVIASQSFHWFANRTALEEIHRVLAPDGRFAIIWNLPDISHPWMAEIWAFVGTLIKENSLITPFDEDWKNVFGLTDQSYQLGTEPYIKTVTEYNIQDLTYSTALKLPYFSCCVTK